MLVKISGEVTNISQLTVKSSGKVYSVVKVLQMDKLGNGFTYPIKFMDSGKVSNMKVKAFVDISDVRLKAYATKAGGAGIDATVF